MKIQDFVFNYIIITWTSNYEPRRSPNLSLFLDLENASYIFEIYIIIFDSRIEIEQGIK